MAYFETHPDRKLIVLRGDDIQTRGDLALAIRRGFGLPERPITIEIETFEWITELKQLQYEEFAVLIYRFRECMRDDSLYKLEAFLQLSKATLPMYINEFGTIDELNCPEDFIYYHFKGIVVHLWDGELPIHDASS
jgi:hypothetical protein